MLTLALTTADKINLAVAAGTVFLAAVAVLQLWQFTRSEGRRTQPVVIGNLSRPRDLQGRYGIYLTNPGAGTGFNVRVGIIHRPRLGLFHRNVEYPLGQPPGSRFTVAAGEREPPLAGPPDFTLQLEELPFALGATDTKAALYARYENAFGRTWRTVNPLDANASFSVRRYWFGWFRQGVQSARRQWVHELANRRLLEELRILSGERTNHPTYRRVLRKIGY